MKKLIVVLSIWAILLSGLEVKSADKVWAAPVSSDGQEFEGDWIVSNYAAEGIRTLQLDGAEVKISKQGGVFRLEGPTTEESATLYRLNGNDLVGTLYPDLNMLKKEFPGFPPLSLKQAASSGKVLYNGRLTMGQEGCIKVEYDGAKLFYMHNAFSDYFDRVELKPGKYKYVLTRKGAAVCPASSNDTNSNTDANALRNARFQGIQQQQQQKP